MNRQQIEALQNAIETAEHARDETLWPARKAITALWREYHIECAERRVRAPLRALQRLSTRD